MASIMNTDLTDLYNQWGQRVAFNEGYAKQKLVEANAAGREAFHLGLDKFEARDQFFAQQDKRFAEAKEFMSSDSAAQITDESITDVEPEPETEPEPIDIDPLGEVSDGEETLGMESVVANETEDTYDPYQEIADAYNLDLDTEHDREIMLSLLEHPQAMDGFVPVDEVKHGWETIRDDDGNVVNVINHDARQETPDEIWEDVFEDLLLQDEMEIYRDEYA